MLYGYRHTLKNRVMFAVHGQQVRTILLYGIHKQTSAGDQRLFIRQQHRFAGTDGGQRWHQPRSTHNRRHDLVNVVQRSHFSGSLLAAQYVSAATVFTQADAQRVGALYIVHHRVAGRKFQTLFNHAVDIFPCDQRSDGKAIGVMAHHIQRAAAN